MMKNKITLIVSIALLIAYWASSAIYALLIAPNPGSVQRVPIYWWAGEFAPIVLVAIISGYVIPDLKCLLSTVFTGTIIFAVGDYIKAALYFRGHIKGPYTDGSVEYVVRYIAFDFATLFVLLGIGWLGAKIVNRVAS